MVAFGGRAGGAAGTWLTGVLIIAFVPTGTPATVKAADLVEHLYLVLRPGVRDVTKRQPMDYYNPQAIPSPLLPPSEYPPFLAVWRRMGREIDRVLPVTGADPEAMEPRAIRLGPSGERAQRFTPAMATDALNAIIRDPAACDGVMWDRVPLAADGRRIRDKPAADRTPAESERLNRLVVEQAFPGVIRQLHGHGWRPTLLVYGVAGILAAGVFWLVVRDRPRSHPWANPAEVELIEDGQAAAAGPAPTAVPWRALVVSRNQWLFCLNQFCSNIGWVFLITLMPRFLDERFHVPVDVRGLMTTVPIVAAAVGMLVGGWLTDRLVTVMGRRWGRAVPMGAFKLPCVLALASVPFLTDPWAVVAAFAVAAMFQDTGVPAVWAFAQDTAGPRVGAVFGWANMWGNAGAAVATYTVGRVAAEAGWDAATQVLAVALGVCAVSGLLANADRPLVGSGNEPPVGSDQGFAPLDTLCRPYRGSSTAPHQR